MANWADRCLAIWVDATLAAAIVTGLAAVAMIQCRQPARRRVWGRLGLSASLIVIPLVWLNPLPEINVWHPSRLFWASGPGPAPAAPGLGPGVTGRLLLAAYGAGLLFALGRLALGLAGTNYLIRRAYAASARSEALLEVLPYAAPETTRPRLGVSERVRRRPVLVGIRRPTILIPPEMDRPGAEDRLRLGLLHELAHAEVADHRFGPIAALAQAAWFFLPQAWWVRNQLRLDAEFLADHRAVEYFGTSNSYANSLVAIAAEASAGDPAFTPVSPTAASRTADSPLRRPGGLAPALIQRVQMLLTCPFDVEDRVPRAWSLGVAAIVALTTLGASSLTTWDVQGSGTGANEPVPRRIHLHELDITPQLLDNGPFDFLIPLPAQFRLTCEVEATIDELNALEILGYRLGPTPGPSAPGSAPGPTGRHQVLIVRGPGGLESVWINDREVVPPHRPTNPAAWLTILPLPGRVTHLRDLLLVW